MELTVGLLRKALEDIPDDFVLADLGKFNDEFKPFLNVKRIMILQDTSENKTWGGKTYVAINAQGSHFTGAGKQKGLSYRDTIL